MIDHHVVRLARITAVRGRLFCQPEAAFGRGGAGEVLAALGVGFRGHGGVCYLCPRLRRLLRLVGLRRYRHVRNVLRRNGGHRVETHAGLGYAAAGGRLLLLGGLVVALALLLRPLELFQALHDGAVRQPFLVLDRRDPGAADIVPRARFVLVLCRVQRELIPCAPIIVTGLVVIRRCIWIPLVR